jgi:cellobiose epimerase
MSLAELRSEVERGLWDGLFNAWFPAAVDQKRGGYFQYMDRAWLAIPEQERFVVYQARLTWCCAMAALRGSRPHLEWTQHGLDGLWNTFWDSRSGGFFWWADIKGKAHGRSAEEKHTYGLAFALYATAGAARALGTPESLGRLKEAWTWFDTSLHDGVHGGWFEVCDAQSSPILEAPSGRTRDIFGLPYGSKAQNSQLHVMEALTEVYRAWPNPAVAERLREMIEVIAVKMLSSEGHLHLLCTRDWQAMSDQASHGHDIEAAFLLRDALDALGESNPEVEAMAKKLAIHALEHAWDSEHNGLVDGPKTGRWGSIKVWWVQAESLGALAYFTGEGGEDETFFSPYLTKQWAFIRDWMLDPEHGGMYPYTSLDGREAREMRKGDPWSGLYHEARAFMTVLDRLPG